MASDPSSSSEELVRSQEVAAARRIHDGGRSVPAVAASDAGDKKERPRGFNNVFGVGAGGVVSARRSLASPSSQQQQMESGEEEEGGENWKGPQG